MPYALNIKKGTVIQHPNIRIEGLVAYEVSQELANQLKHIINIVVFDSVVHIKKQNTPPTPLYGIDKNTLEKVS